MDELTQIHLMAWWRHSGAKFVAAQWRRLLAGCSLGCLIAIATHLVWRDSTFGQVLRKKWLSLSHQTTFDGVSAYKSELIVLCVVLTAALSLPAVGAFLRYLRSWWAGIVSLTISFSAIVTAMLLSDASRTISSILGSMSLVAALIAVELWRSVEVTSIKTPGRRVPSLDIPHKIRDAGVEARWQPSSSDDPILEWSQDIIGRTSVVELLAEHIFVHHTPIVALHGSLGDGKSSVLRLLRRSLAKHVIAVSFSTWLPGSDETLAVDLFRDIASDCRQRFYIPQLRKRAVAYARTISGSVSYLAGLREILPTQSQQQEVEELRDTLARVPVPIVVLLDEVDRMQREEILVLLKILRGASSIPNVTFICAFNDKEVRRQLSVQAPISYDYLDKFFPVTVNLAPPNPDMLGRLLQSRIHSAAINGKWFLGTNDKTFAELLDGMWEGSLTRICTNLRKASLLLNDLSASARIIGAEVNTIDLVGIETIRRFEPMTYELLRKNPASLTYGADSWMKGQYISDKQKEDHAKGFFELLDAQVAQSGEPDALRYILSLLFPAFGASKERVSIHSIVRPTNEEIAEKEKRICDSDYFAIYFRAAVPEDMFSEAELSATVARLNEAKTESACDHVFREILDGIPRHQARRADFLWKLGRAVRSRLNDAAAESLAYVAASRATDYTYDLVNIGEAARALNIVFESAQRFSESRKAQQILTGAMKRTTDDTFALRLLEYTENKDRNKILTNFSYVDPTALRNAFMDRMIDRYGQGVDASKADITTGDVQAFHKWAENSAEDQRTETEFWRGYIGGSRKRLAQAINFIYPPGYSWSEDPRKWLQKFIPVDELKAFLETLKDDGEPLSEIESSAIARFQDLLNGKWFDISRPDLWMERQQGDGS